MTPFLTQGAPDVAREEEIPIPGPAGDIRALLFAPETPPARRFPSSSTSMAVAGSCLSPDSHARLTKHFAVGAGRDRRERRLQTRA